jgi:hypothetical protein
MSCYEHTYTSTFSNALIQASIVFIFLTIFFYEYVVSTERDEFINQVSMIVDSVDMPSNMFPVDPDKKKALKVLLYGIIDDNEDILNKSTQETIKNIDENNAVILKNSVLTVLVVLIFAVILLIIFALFGYCVPVSKFLKEGFFILLFIFLTEYMFLNVITKNYISTSSVRVKREVLQSIINYIDKRENL